ncbi:MAG TPA: GNAT family N-acetyltransferase [Polyangiaceae bacterium]|nr:GNAT family N-acetyltransferase [Polyangiaceae bacterium]
MTSSALRHRRCIVLRGGREETLREATRLTSGLAEVAVVDGGRLAPARARALLGRSLDAVVLDLHAGLSADTLGQCHGLVRGGGALVLCLPPPGQPVSLAELAVYPFAPEQVGTRFWQRLERRLARLDTAAPQAPLAAPPRAELGNAEQRRVAARLADAFATRSGLAFALIAERGRGKSSALGLALGLALERAPLSVAVSAPSEDAAAELLRFAPARDERLRFLLPEELTSLETSPDVIVVDEAAQLSVAWLRALVARHPSATLAFATTTHGYEGTGRGFVLRFLDWLERQPRPSERLSLTEPIRWSAGDALERWVYDVLALDAEPPSSAPEPRELPRPRRITADELLQDEPLLRGVFGLLVSAHYRTTPGDLERLLDAPNLELHAIADGQRVQGATLVAREGGLPRSDCEALARGAWRIRGHALADTLIVHAGYPEAGELSIVRSVRIATHPALRQRGVARALVEHVHASYAAELFGTVFGATPELIAFRRALGYSLVRIGSAWGVSSGEPSVVMLRARSARAQALVAALRADLARNLPLQLPLLAADGGLRLAPDLVQALAADLPAPTALDDAQVEARVVRFAESAQTMEAALYALSRFIGAQPVRLARLARSERALLERRVLGLESWASAAHAAGLEGARAAMRAFRPALRRLLQV